MQHIDAVDKAEQLAATISERVRISTSCLSRSARWLVLMWVPAWCQSRWCQESRERDWFLLWWLPVAAIGATSSARLLRRSLPERVGSIFTN